MTQHTLKSNFETVLLPPKGQFLGRSGTKSAARTLESDLALLPVTGVHPAVIKIAMSAVVWFLAVAWFDFSGGPEVDLNLAVVTGFFVMFFTLFLLAASMVIDDPRSSTTMCSRSFTPPRPRTVPSTVHTRTVSETRWTCTGVLGVHQRDPRALRIGPDGS